jgi:TPR repeat protein
MMTFSNPLKHVFFRHCILVKLCAMLFAGSYPAYAGNAETAYKQGQYKQAYHLWLRQAESGNPDAQFNVAIMLENGQGVERNLFAALGWYELAAGQKYPFSKQMITQIRQTIAKEHRETLLKWLPKAEAGDAPSQIAASNIYADGKILKQDRAEALKWLLIAQENIQNTSELNRIERLRTLLTNNMSSSQIEEAQNRVLIWKNLRKDLD